MSGLFSSATSNRRRRVVAIAASQFNQLPQLPACEVSPSETPEPATQSTSHAAAARIREMLEDTVPRTWVFAGDNLGYDSAQAKRSYAEHVGDFIRTKLGRKLDVVIDLTVSESSIHSLRDSVEWRISKYQPDVVCLMPGLSDLSEGQAGLDAFVRSVQELAEFLEHEGTVLVLCTPPLNLAAEHETYRELPAYVIALRRLAALLGIVLIDHWKYWHIARKTKPIEEWLSPDGTQLLLEGHRRLARFTLRTLGLSIDN